MAMPKCGVLLGIVAYSLFAATLSADETAETILTKYIEAMGGLERIKNVRSARCTADVWFNGQEGHVTWFEKWPGSSLKEVQWPNGKIRQFSTDSPAEGNLPEKLRPPTEEIFGELVAYVVGAGSTNKIEYLGQQDEEGERALVIALHKPGGRSTVYYLDPATFLPFKIVFEDSKDTNPTAVYVGGWYREGGFALHRREDHYRNGQLFESQSKIQYVLNPSIDDAVFGREPAK
jgi:hypothetical protein